MATANIVDVCNGYSDRTADMAERFEPRVEVFAVKEASQIATPNAGDAHGGEYPRVCVDADVRISDTSITALIEPLS